jgi:glycosyltransferase involved in cell wall biosynthesis
MKVLIVGNPQRRDVFVPNFVTRLTGAAKIHVDILFLDPIANMQEVTLPGSVRLFLPRQGALTKYLAGIPKIRLFQKWSNATRLLARMEQYDLCHIHGVDPFYGLVITQLKKHAGQVISSIYGSEFYLCPSKLHKMLMARVYRASDLVSLTNEATRADFVSTFGDRYRNRSQTLRYGLTPLEEIRRIEHVSASECKSRLAINPDTITVMCGYQGNPNNQHFAILSALERVSRELPDNLMLLLPMTYGGTPEYMRQVKQRLIETGLPFKLFEEFVPDREVAYLRKATDIMINLPASDQFSGSMQEHMYAGSVVITGNWLPYSSFDALDILTVKVPTVDEVGAQLLQVIVDLDNYRQKAGRNREAIWQLSSWDESIARWLTVYSNLLSQPIPLSR